MTMISCYYMLRLFHFLLYRTAGGDERHVDANTELEPWVDWVRRVTHEAEERLKTLAIKDWITTYLKYKWEWSQKITEMDFERWAYVVAAWEPGLEPNASRRDDACATIPCICLQHSTAPFPTQSKRQSIALGPAHACAANTEG